MTSAAFPPCARCSYRHGPGPCLTVRVLPSGVAGYDAASCPEWALGAALRGARRNNALRAERKHARALQAGRNSADSPYGRKRAKK